MAWREGKIAGYENIVWYEKVGWCAEGKVGMIISVMEKWGGMLSGMARGEEKIVGYENIVWYGKVVCSQVWPGGRVDSWVVTPDVSTPSTPSQCSVHSAPHHHRPVLHTVLHTIHAITVLHKPHHHHTIKQL